MDGQIQEVEAAISEAGREMAAAEKSLTEATAEEEKMHLRKKEEQLREEKVHLRKKEEQLREEKVHLRKKGEQLRDEKLLALQEKLILLRLSEQGDGRPRTLPCQNSESQLPSSGLLRPTRAHRRGMATADVRFLRT